MSLAVTDDHRALAESVAGLVARHASPESTRAGLSLQWPGGRPAYWSAFAEQGLLSMHLPEAWGGAGFGLSELAVAVEETGRGLLPGPFLPTVITSAALARYAPAIGSRLGAQLAEGLPGATALEPGGLTATADGDGLRVSGTVAPVLGADGAELLLLAARLGDVDAWFVVEPGRTPGVAVTPVDGVDLTRGLARVELSDVAVPAADRLPDVTTAQVRGLAAALLGAEAAGICRWLVETAGDYAKVREQFGRTIGSFQAVKHKLARLLLRSSLVAAAAWDAVRAEGDGEEQLHLATTTAALFCLPTTMDLALDAVTTLGGIGYTYEHDITLYWRRAVCAHQLVAPMATWAEDLGRAVTVGRRDFDVELPEDDKQFREVVARNLAEVAGLPKEQQQPHLAELGYVVSYYPRPYGIAATPVQQVVLAEEFARAGLEQPNIVIGEWALPTILQHGTQEQVERFVPPTLRGEVVWCQLFSEPGAGSDLASLRTRAEKVDGGWRLNGQKVWNTFAHLADWGICLARTNPDVPKHAGISFFLVDMHTPGVEARPLRQATGEAEFNEVFLTDVFVPDDCVVGEIDQGWRIARTTLASERLSIGASPSVESLGRVIALVEAGDAGVADPQVAATLGRLAAESHAVSALGLQQILLRLSGGDVGAAASLLKVAGTDFGAAARRAEAECVGSAGALWDGPGGAAIRKYLSTPAILIGGGTVEIMLNVIGERLLGLPRS